MVRSYPGPLLDMKLIDQMQVGLSKIPWIGYLR
jgi:hypothetical protein